MTMKNIQAFTDGSCLGNPGPGGWAAVLRCNGAERELSGGFSRTTNNRMEILAVIETLSVLTEPCSVDLYTDSQYVRNAVEQQWLTGWSRNGWKTRDKKPVKNRDLWERLQPLLALHRVRFHWVRGHSGHPENERCDVLARTLAASPGLPADTEYRE